MQPAVRSEILAAALCILAMLTVSALQAQSPAAGAARPDPNSVAEVDAGLGPCTADFTVTDADGKPVYAAKIRVHLAYGFAHAHKLDMEAGTNAAGKARFIGLPDHPKDGLFFRASEGDRSASAFDDPNKTCKARFTVQLLRNLQ